MDLKTSAIATFLCAMVAMPVEPSAAAAPSAAIPPAVNAALNRMAAALRGLNSFELKADVTTEAVLVSGQKLQNAAQMTFDVQRPHGLFVDIDSAQKHRQIFYNGKSFTIFGPSTGYYATIDAPPTIKAMLQQASDRYGFEFPMADLFQWGTEAFPVDRITTAIYAGADHIDGKSCEHLAFRQKGVDWQLWVAKDGPALPCKLVIVNTDDAAQPQTTATYSWSTTPTFADAKFNFAPPTEGRRILLGQVEPASAKGGK
jgi:hypothetical protein